MKSLKLIIASLFVFSPFAAHSTLITFDEVPNNTVLTDQYMSLGLVIAGFENGGAVSQPIATTAFSGEFGGPPVSGQVLENRDADNSRADLIRFIFSGAASGIEFDFLPFGSSGPNTLIEAFDQSMNLLFSSTIGGPATSSVNFHYVLPVAGVYSFTMSQPTDSWVWGMDNLQFGIADSVAVPEPGTLALLGIGLFGVGLSRRRKKA